MPPHRRVRSRTGRLAGGFTLFEMIIVIVILGLLAGLVLTRGPVRSRRVELEATARTLVGALRLARGQAIARDVPATVRTAAHGFAIDGGATWQVPPQQVISPAVVVFTPEGESSGGVITIRQGDTRIAINVEWLTGQVQMTRLQP